MYQTSRDTSSSRGAVLLRTLKTPKENRELWEENPKENTARLLSGYQKPGDKSRDLREYQ